MTTNNVKQGACYKLHDVAKKMYIRLSPTLALSKIIKYVIFTSGVVVLCLAKKKLLATTDYTAYAVSKIGVNRLTEIQAKEFTSDPFKLPGILVNAVSVTKVVMSSVNSRLNCTSF